MRFISSCLLSLALLFAVPAFAQPNNARFYMGSAKHMSQIVGTDAVPVRGAMVKVTGPGIGAVTTQTDAQGYAGFDLAPAPYKVTVSGGTLSAGATIVRIELISPLKPGYYLHDGPPDLYLAQGLTANFLLARPRFEVRIATGN
ncbi:MAG: hypothetical protein O7C63_07250 [Alphaproteobacteria bacterium]|nr:hypothetical protein [Alphaproteobacteria bacterium]